MVYSLTPHNKTHYWEGFLFRHYECQFVFDTPRTQYFLREGTYEKVQANNDNEDEKSHKGQRVYNTFTVMTFSALVPAVVRFSLVIERLRVQGNVFIPM